MKQKIELCCVFLILISSLFASISRAKERIITIGGGYLTEIIYQLNSQNKLVGIDITSTYPEQVKSFPKVSHWQQLRQKDYFP